MKVHTVICLGLSSLLAAATWAAAPAKEKPAAGKDAPAADSRKADLPPGHPQIPAERPALPPGHPELPGRAEAARGNLPAGHPDISTQAPSRSGASLPPGHPDVPPEGGAPGGPGRSQGALPPGHPNIGGGAGTTKPKGPAATHGTLFVRAYQGTGDAPSIGAEPVSVELHHQGEVIQRMEGTLGKDGTAVFERLPLARRFQPVVRVLHSGVNYQAVGDVMDGYHAGQQIDLALYETTETEPAWSVYMRHVIVEPTPDGARVTEALSLENPTDRSWIGAARQDGKRQTVTLAVPDGAGQFRFSGGGETSVKIEKGKLVNTLPLMPGVSQVQFSYLVPPQDDGKVRVKIVAPKAVKAMMVFIAETGSPVSVEGLQASGAHDMGENGKALVYGGNNLKEGQAATLTVVPLPPAKKQQADAGSENGAGGTVAKAVAGVGGGVGLVLGVGYVLLKPPAKARTA